MESLVLRIHVAWWARLYLLGLYCFVWLTGLEPDYAKVARVVQRGIRLVAARPAKQRYTVPAVEGVPQRRHSVDPPHNRSIP